MRKLLLTSLLCLLAFSVFGQDSDSVEVNKKRKLIQLSGVVMSSDSLMPVYYANIAIKNSYRGTSSNFKGFFSLVVKERDTLLFSAVGYKKALFIVPDTLAQDRYSIIQLMSSDTINLPESIIYPWPKPHEFRQAFLELEVPDDDIAIAKKNLEREKLKELGEAMAMDANENLDYQFRQRAASYYHYKQVPPMTIFDPIRWAQFIKAWKRGDFKRD